MDLLKQLPLSFRGQLHDVRLVNFSIEKRELEPHMPAGLQLRDYHGRALISMVNVDLRAMHLSGMPFPKFGYRHIAFRVLVKDEAYTDGQGNKGIYFFRSFTSSPLIASLGSCFTVYNLEQASITADAWHLDLHQGRKFIEYDLLRGVTADSDPELKQTIGALDRAYAFVGATLSKVQIQRESWPIEPIQCTHFRTNFFDTAQLEGAFAVRDMIPYHWLPLTPVAL